MQIYASLHDRLKTQHLTIAELIRNLPPQRILVRPTPEKWNIHDTLAHLAQYQITFINRVNQILHKDLPHFERYKAEHDPDFEKFGKLDDQDLFKSLYEQRTILNDLIFSLSKKDLERIGVHKKFGSLTIIQWLEFFVLHEAHHIFTIFQLANDTDIK